MLSMIFYIIYNLFDTEVMNLDLVFRNSVVGGALYYVSFMALTASASADNQ